MTNACGVLMLSKPRNEYIKEVCILSLPSAYRVSVVSIENRNLSLQIEASEESSKCQLTIKNAQAMKALFNIAHCLGTVLGSSWLMVLEILEHLDRIIETNRSFQRGTRVPVIEMSVSNKEKQDALATQEDMLLLDAALSQLFESSISFDEVALSHLLYALGTLSLSSLASAATDELESASANSITQQMQSMETIPVPVQMFSLIKFVKTLEVNVFRITQVWDFAVGHLNCVINHKVPSIRAYGVFCLGKLTKLALAQSLENVKTLSIPEDPLLNINIEMERENAAFSVNKPDKACGREEYEGFILGPFEELYRSKYEDSKRNIILAVHDTVQSCGQVLSFGWVRIISLLKDVVRNFLL